MTDDRDLSADAHRTFAHTIDTLIDALKELKANGVPGHTIVVLSQDAEGNGFSPLTSHDGAETAMYAPDCTWSGERFMTEEERQATANDSSPYGPDDYDAAPDHAFPAVFLWPVN